MADTNYVSNQVRTMVKVACKVPGDFDPTHLECVCKDSEKLDLRGIGTERVRDWLNRHAKCLEEFEAKASQNRKGW